MKHRRCQCTVHPCHLKDVPKVGHLPGAAGGDTDVATDAGRAAEVRDGASHRVVIVGGGFGGLYANSAAPVWT